MAASDYDKLTIKIVANTSGAIDSIKSLSSRLEDLEKQAERMDLSRLKDIQKILQDIANIDFSKVSSSLYSVAKSFEKIGNISISKMVEDSIDKMDLGQIFEEVLTTTEPLAQKIENVKKKIKETSNTAEQSKIDEPFTVADEAAEHFLTTIKELGKLNESGLPIMSFATSTNEIVRGFRDYDELLGQAKEKIGAATENFVEFDRVINTLATDISGADSSFEGLGQAMSEIGLNGTQMEMVLRTIGQETKTFDDTQIRKVEKAMKQLGFSSGQVNTTIKNLKKTTKDTTNTAKNGLQKVALKMKSLALYRVMRLALMKIQQAFTEAIQELAKFDSGFNEAISEIKSTVNYLARSLLAMVSPLIQLVAPVIKAIGSELGKIANQIGQAMSGDTFTQAEESAEDYAESLKKVKSLTLGIDELNVISKDEEKSLFSETDGGQATMLSETFGKIMEFVGVINKTLSSFMNKILPAITHLLEPILDIVGNIISLVDLLINSTGDSVNDSLVSFVEMIGKIFKFVASLVNELMPVLVGIINVIAPIINIINTILQTIFEVVGNIFNVFADWAWIIDIITVPLGFILQVVSTIFYFVEALVKTIRDLITFNWANLGNDWQEMSAKVQESWSAWAESVNNTNSFVESGETQSYTQSPTIDTDTTSGLTSGDSYSGSNYRSGSSGSGTKVNVYIDGREVAARVEEIIDGRGYSMSDGGYKYGG